MTTTKTFRLRGHWRQKGGSLAAGTFSVMRDGADWFDGEGYGVPLIARRYQITPNISGIEIVGAGEFLPDDGECERVHMPVRD
jgi:hypothetical protein